MVHICIAAVIVFNKYVCDKTARRVLGTSRRSRGFCILLLLILLLLLGIIITYRDDFVQRARMNDTSDEFRSRLHRLDNDPNLFIKTAYILSRDRTHAGRKGPLGMSMTVLSDDNIITINKNISPNRRIDIRCYTAFYRNIFLFHPIR